MLKQVFIFIWVNTFEHFEHIMLSRILTKYLKIMHL
jgi:hypothetical protein